jgi:hypothetical protein
MPAENQPRKLSKLGRAALHYATQFRWRVFPLHSTDDAGMCTCGNAACGGPGKHPRTPRGCLDASLDSAQVRAWWERWPDANVGIATGAGLVVIDVDPRSGGDDAMVDLRRSLGALPDTIEALTGGGGRHVYLSTPVEVRNSAGTLGAGVDVRGDGGYVVAPPSTHASGTAYAWELSSRPDEVEAAPVPQPWLDAMTARPKLRALPGGKGEPFPEGQRNASLYKRACSMRSSGFDHPAILAAIMSENDARCVPPLDPAEVKAIVASACKHPEGYSPEVRAKVEAREAARAEGLTAAQPKNESGDWLNDLYRSPKGAVRNTFANLCTILRHAGEYGERLRYNEMLIAPTLNGRPMQEAELGLMREAIERQYGFSPGADALAQALLAVAWERRYHPVRDYLAALEWDGVARIDRVAADVLRAEGSPINNTMVRAWFVSAVARAMDPGCKCDTALVLVGEQGARKSTFYRVLAGEWFSDTAVDIENKDAMMQINGAWIYELGEIEHVTGRAHAGRIKAFISSARDTFRAPFHRTLSAYPRSNVIVGSTNEDQFLNDPTGSRRFWCIRVGGRIDIDALERDRDQLWAEAASYFRAGEAWWLTTEAEAALRAASDEFRVVDPWEAAVARWLEERSPIDLQRPVTTQRLLVDVLGMRLPDIGQREANRIAAIMKRMGWANHVARVEGKVCRVWEPVR